MADTAGSLSRPLRWVALAAATAAVGVLTQLLVEAIGASVTIPAQPGTDETMRLEVGFTAAFSAGTALFALVGTTVLRRFRRRALPVALAIGLLVLAVSMVPVMMAWSVVANPWGLVALHLAVGVTVLGGLPAALGYRPAPAAA